MNEKDKRLQDFVDGIAHNLLSVPVEEWEERFEYGDGTTTIDEVRFHYFRHSPADGTHRIVIEEDQKLFLGFYKKYLSGVIWSPNETTRRMTDDELGDYD